MPKSPKPEKPRAKKEPKPKKTVEKKPKEKKEKAPKPPKKKSHNIEFGNDINIVFARTEKKKMSNPKISKQSVQLISDLVQNVENRIIDVAFETCETVDKKMKLTPEHLKAATMVVLPRDLAHDADEMGVASVNRYVE